MINTKLTFDWCHDFCCFLYRITTVLLSTSNLIMILAFRLHYKRGFETFISSMNWILWKSLIIVCQALWDLAERNGDVQHRGLNTDEINVLPTSKFAKKPSSTSSQSEQSTVSEDTECRVCLSQFEPNETLRTLPCLHRFHRNCIDKWIKVPVLFCIIWLWY